MRSIIFRGKRVDNGEWVEGNLLKENGRYFINIFMNECVDCVFAFDSKKGFKGFNACFMVEVIPETVGQYTGLCDKNGKKIFEGDIVKWVNIQAKGRCVQGAVIMFGFNWCVKNIFNGDYENWYWGNNTHEIIGNIHTTPELLEVEE